ncbi:MAG: hypothetical protein K0R39_3360 [Symbiobacteriaceae bacterium]|jgi:hypothetical protein|nr:hypothetical protein [Symbiobacteriaceae bacterium]
MSNDPKQVLEQAKQQCEQVKQQMSSTLNTIQNPQAKTAYQMAINAVDNAIAQCHTAGSTLQ